MLDIRTLALNRVGYLGLGFAHLHLLPDVSGTSVRSIPTPGVVFHCLKNTDRKQDKYWTLNL